MANRTRDEEGSITLTTAGKIPIMLGGCIAVYGVLGLTPVLPEIEAHFHEYPEAGALTRLLVSVLSFMNMIGSPLAGLLADRFGHRRIVLIAMFVFCIAGTAGFFIDNLYALILTRVFVGLGMAGVTATIMTILTTRSTGNTRDKWIGYVIMVSMFSGVALLPFAGFLGSIGWQWPFLGHLVALPLIILVLVGLEPDKLHVPAETTAAAPPSSVTGGGQSTISPVAMVAITSVCVGVMISTPVLFIPFHMYAMGITDTYLMSMGMVAVTLSGGLASYAYGYLRTRLSTTMIFAIGLGIIASGLLLFSFAQSYSVMLATLLFAGIGSGLLAPNIYAAATLTSTDANRGKIIGICRGCLYGGPLLGQLVLEPVVAWKDAGMALTVLGGFGIFLTLTQVWKIVFGRPANA